MYNDISLEFRAVWHEIWGPGPYSQSCPWSHEEIKSSKQLANQRHEDLLWRQIRPVKEESLQESRESRAKIEKELKKLDPIFNVLKLQIRLSAAIALLGFNPPAVKKEYLRDYQEPKSRQQYLQALRVALEEEEWHTQRRLHLYDEQIGVELKLSDEEAIICYIPSQYQLLDQEQCALDIADFGFREEREAIAAILPGVSSLDEVFFHNAAELLFVSVINQSDSHFVISNPKNATHVFVRLQLDFCDDLRKELSEKTPNQIIDFFYGELLRQDYAPQVVCNLQTNAEHQSITFIVHCEAIRLVPELDLITGFDSGSRFCRHHAALELCERAFRRRLTCCDWGALYE